jgi:shikimate kinase
MQMINLIAGVLCKEHLNGFMKCIFPFAQNGELLFTNVRFYWYICTSAIYSYMKIFLIGFMGSGKTVIGKLLSERLGYGFVDTDQIIEEKFGEDIPSIFKKHGEDVFRRAENDVIHQIIKKPGKLVISSGGGMPCREENLKLMNFFGISIYLKRNIDDLAEILQHETHNRPLLAEVSDLKTTITCMLSEREPCYNLSKHVVEISQSESSEDVVDRIVELLNHR